MHVIKCENMLNLTPARYSKLATLYQITPDTINRGAVRMVQM